MLRPPSIRNEFCDTADRAMKDQMTDCGCIAQRLMTERDDRARHRAERRIKAVGLPREKSVWSLGLDDKPNIHQGCMGLSATTC